MNTHGGGKREREEEHLRFCRKVSERKKKYIKKHKSDLKSLADIVKEQQERVKEFFHHTHKYAR
jgi:hypothetical protein